MEWGTVSSASMAGMVFSLAVSVLGPAILGILVWKKTKASGVSLLAGCGIFIVFALILEQILHVAVLSSFSVILQNSLFLYALYGGLAAAAFEECGRLLAMKYLMKNRLDGGNALMYGVGHGGAEAILIMGITSVNNLASSMMINSGGIGQTLAQLEPELQAVTYEQLSALWLTPAYQFYLGGVERIAAMALQLCLSVLVYKAVKTGRKQYFGAAFLLHFLMDFLMVIVAANLPVWAVEAVLLVFTAIVVWRTAAVYPEKQGGKQS